MLKKMAKGNILIADDDAAIRTVLNQALARAGYAPRATGNAATLWRWISQGEGDLVITDVLMPDESAFDLIPRVKKLRPELPIIVMSAQNTFMASDILIVDDEADIRELISGILEDEGHGTRLAKDSDETLAAIEERKPSLVILDIWLQGSKLDGLELLDRIKRSHPDLPVVIISGHGNIETAVAAIKRGAYDYIEKPFKADRLVLIVARALEASKLRRENRELRERSAYSFEMIGRSSAINQLRQAIEKVAPTNSRVLITGPSGCGKELAARVMHMKSARADGPFVVLNAAAMVPDRVELELFGTEEGVGSGPRKVGALEEAHMGSLYIDEVSDMPLETQGKILRVLVEQRFQRLGGGPKVHVDVRVISSTSRELQKEMSSGRLREDLFHRLNVVPIRVPGLSERREDIPELVRYFVQAISVASGLPPRRIGEDAMPRTVPPRLSHSSAL